jgi:hypothetical protein
VEVTESLIEITGPHPSSIDIGHITSIDIASGGGVGNVAVYGPKLWLENGDCITLRLVNPIKPNDRWDLGGEVETFVQLVEQLKQGRQKIVVERNPYLRQFAREGRDPPHNPNGWKLEVSPWDYEPQYWPRPRLGGMQAVKVGLGVILVLIVVTLALGLIASLAGI